MKKSRYVLKAKKLSKKINDQLIINSMNLSVPKQSILGIVGPNGSGKTTLFKLLLGLSKPSSGEIVFSENISKKDIGSLIEMPAIYPYMTGRQNIDYFSSFFNVSEASAKKYITELSIDSYLDKKVANYSLGMKQRLGIVISLLKNPKILILDEPTNGLDPEGIYDLRNFLLKLVELKKISIIISSHDLNQMEQICDTIVFIQKGVLISAPKEKINVSTWKIDCSNPIEAVKLINGELKHNFIYYSGLDGTISEIIKKLVDNNYDIFSVVEEKSSLESQYLTLFTEKGELSC